MKDVIVTSIEKYITDSLFLLPNDLSIYVTFDKKNAEVTEISSYLPEMVSEGSTSFKLYDSMTNDFIEQNIVGLTLTDSMYSDIYTITDYNNGIVTLSSPALRDFDEGEIFTLKLNTKNTLQVMANSISLLDRTQVYSRHLRPRLKYFDLVLGVDEDSEGIIVERFIRWLNLIFSTETYLCYDKNGNRLGSNKFYLNSGLSWTDVQPNVNNKIFLGRVGFLIYEDTCKSVSEI